MPRQFRYAIKLLFASTLYYSGLLHLYRKLRFRNRAWVLMYHRVLTPDDAKNTCSSEAIVVTRATFERHLGFLRRHFSVVTLREFSDRLLRQRHFERPTCLITFDDGWKDNVVNALPSLTSSGLPATIFLATGYIGSGDCFWQERLTRLLCRLPEQPALRQHSLVQQYKLDSLFDADAGSVLPRARLLARDFKNNTVAEIDALIAGLEQALTRAGSAKDTNTIDRFMDWHDVEHMKRAGIHFGSHTVSHRMLTRLGESEVTQELTVAKKTIEDQLGSPVDTFAYPNGDHDASTVRVARDVGYQLAFTTQRGTVAPGDDTYRLRRINIHEKATRHTPLLFATMLGIL
jgi:peptidoglycan/xylan/chitin deacetylase (PgdA/CDA1 family)